MGAGQIQDVPGQPAGPRLHLWTGDRLSDAAIDAGLFSWLIDRTG
jgi:hypothetical protein